MLRAASGSEGLSPGEALDDFLTSLRGTDRKPNTITYYRTSLRQFARWCAEQHLGLCDITARRVRAWFAHREDVEHVNRTTQYHDWCTLRKFLAFCRREGYMAGDPMADLRYRKPRPAPPQTPSDEQVAALLRAIKDRWNPKVNPRARYTAEAYRTRISRRDYCLVLGLYLTGARRGELVGLRRDDIIETGPDAPCIRFADTKDAPGSARLVPVTPDWLEAVRSYLRVRPKVSPDPPQLFLGEYGEPLSPGWFGKKFAAYAEFAGCPNLTAQWLRRYRSRRLVKAGDLWTASQILGNSPETLRRHYLTRDPEHLRAVWQASLSDTPIVNRRSRKRLPT